MATTERYVPLVLAGAIFDPDLEALGLRERETIAEFAVFVRRERHKPFSFINRQSAHNFLHCLFMKTSADGRYSHRLGFHGDVRCR